MKKVFNFSAGPAILPTEVFEQTADACRSFSKSGLSILEMSHRSKEIIAVMDEAIALVKELLGVPQGYQVLFLQGGASLQFSMVPYNLLPQTGKAVYIDTGVWAKKASKEAKLFGDVVVAASSSDKNYNYLPGIPQNLPADAVYCHVTSNNTIFGTQMSHFPKISLPYVADMSSDIFSRPIDVSQFGLIYAGAQKNLACAGTTLVIVREDLLGKAGRTIPSMLDYKIHIEGESMFNTPPVISIYVSLLTLRWLKKTGGLVALEQHNKAKAGKLYDAIDNSKLFTGTANKADRSLMNVTFVTQTPELEEAFLALAKERGLDGLKGHRSVGGFRASIYNAMPMEGIDALVSALQDFDRAHA